MADRFNRILALSKRTGDTVIVHDPTEPHDLVVLPFDQYENLVSSDREFGDFDEYLLEDMSERELIDKINRDIAIWRSYQELNQQEHRAALIEDQLVDEPLTDPFEEDFSHRSDWHRVSELIDGRVSRVEHTDTDESSDPIQTYTPVEDEPTLRPQAFAREGIGQQIPRQASVTDPVFEDESELEGGDDPVFFEEPIS